MAKAPWRSSKNNTLRGALAFPAGRRYFRAGQQVGLKRRELDEERTLHTIREEAEDIERHTFGLVELARVLKLDEVTSYLVGLSSLAEDWTHPEALLLEAARAGNQTGLAASKTKRKTPSEVFGHMVGPLKEGTGIPLLLDNAQFDDARSFLVSAVDSDLELDLRMNVVCGVLELLVKAFKTDPRIVKGPAPPVVHQLSWMGGLQRTTSGTVQEIFQRYLDLGALAIAGENTADAISFIGGAYGRGGTVRSNSFLIRALLDIGMFAWYDVVDDFEHSGVSQIKIPVRRLVRVVSAATPLDRVS